MTPRGQKTKQMLKKGKCHCWTLELVIPSGKDQSTVVDEKIKFGVNIWFAASEEYLKSLHPGAVIRAYVGVEND